MEDPFDTTRTEANLPEFLYTDNSKGGHGAIIFKCNATTIEEADRLFKEEKGYDPKKDANIGCVTEYDVNERWRAEYQKENE